MPSGRMLGRCRISHRVGAGSMGVVYKAFHTTLEIPVAVKILRPPLLDSEGDGWRSRLRREAQITARLNHPGLVRVLDYGEEAESPYLVMEFVEGQTLEAILLQRDPIGEHLALRILGQIATAIHAAHQAGVIHRDIKPANILIDPAGHLKIADLGLARDPHAAAITHSSGITGTPHYMAPESLQGDIAPDHRVDLYAMGILLYRMLFTRLPYSGTLHQVLVGHMSGQPDWTIPEGMRISPGTLYMARRLLEKWPAKRLQTAIEVVQGCREQLARIDAQHRIEAESTARKSAVATTSSSSRITRAIRDRLRAETSLKDGRTILHATSRERIVAWLLLGLFAFLTARGLLAR